MLNAMKKETSDKVKGIGMLVRGCSIGQRGQARCHWEEDFKDFYKEVNKFNLAYICGKSDQGRGDCYSKGGKMCGMFQEQLRSQCS